MKIYSVFGSPKFHWIRLEYVQCAKIPVDFFWAVRYTRIPVEIPVDFSSEKKSSRPQKIFGWIMYRSLSAGIFTDRSNFEYFKSWNEFCNFQDNFRHPVEQAGPQKLKLNFAVVKKTLCSWLGLCTWMSSGALPGLRLWTLWTREIVAIIPFSNCRANYPTWRPSDKFLKIYGVKEALVETKRLTTDEDFWSRYLAQRGHQRIQNKAPIALSWVDWIIFKHYSCGKVCTAP